MGRRVVTVVLLDTHAWVWSLMAAHRLTEAAKTAISTAQAVHVSPISLFEVAQKVRVGKWPEMQPHLSALAADEQALYAPFSRSVVLLAGVDGLDASRSLRSHHRGDGGRARLSGDLEG